MNLEPAASALQRLETFLIENKNPSEIEILTPDASVREYFRVNWKDSTAIACVYPEAFAAAEQTYLDVTKLFRAGNLPVAEIYTFDEPLGIIVQEDLGDLILRNVLSTAERSARDDLINEAITLIAKIQAATSLAFELNSIASRLRFDEEKLLWELNFFKTHYFETYQKIKLPLGDEDALIGEFVELASELERRARVLCHRDFHAANLMIDRNGAMRIIDHQDARIGAASYDLVSLLLDRVLIAPDAEWLAGKKEFFRRERGKFNLDSIDAADFDDEFDLMTIQRCLKAVGTFSFQSVTRGKTHFVQFIEPMLEIVSDTCRHLQRFPNLQRIILG